MTGPLEETNKAYAIAKIAGIEMCRSYNRQYGTQYRAVMPTNLYGPGDNFDLEKSHVIPALIRKCHEAKLGGMPTVTVWGTGKPLREFLHVDDLADACIYIMAMEEKIYNTHINAPSPMVNIGIGKEISINDLAEVIRDVVGFQGEIEFDTSKPDGTPQKLLDVSRLTNMGWKQSIGLRDGLTSTYRWFLEHQDSFRS